MKSTSHVKCLIVLLCLSISSMAAANPRTAAERIAADEVVIEIKAVAGLRFDATRFAIPPGAKVTIRLENTDDLSHNLLITAPGKRRAVVRAAEEMGAAGPAQDYTPDLVEVLWAMPVLEPGASASISFTAPEKKGVYPYVCTLPGHGTIMYGAMYVTDEALGPLSEDPNVPPHLAGDPHKAAVRHPYPYEPPTVSRTFMPDASPAAIATWLTDDLSYCWDAGRSMLRYAWRGGFIENAAHWQGKGKEIAEVVGSIFYRNETGFPLRVGSPDYVPEVRFLGYRLHEGIPTYRYRMDGIDVSERITARPEGDGLIRSFEIQGLEQPLWFATSEADGVSYQASAGTWSNGMLRLQAGQAHAFTVTMIDQEPALP